MRRLVAALMVLLGIAAVACFVMLAGAETPAERAVDAVLFLLLVALTMGLSFVIWPRGAR